MFPASEESGRHDLHTEVSLVFETKPVRLPGSLSGLRDIHEEHA